jgi:PAS domain-containing protein
MSVDDEMLDSGAAERPGDGGEMGALVRAHDLAATPLGLFSEMPEQRRADELLRQQAALLDLAHDAIVVRAPDGRIITWNEGATALYGWTAAEAVGQVTHDLLRTRVGATGATGAEIDAVLAARRLGGRAGAHPARRDAPGRGEPAGPAARRGWPARGGPGGQPR